MTEFSSISRSGPAKKEPYKASKKRSADSNDAESRPRKRSAPTRFVPSPRPTSRPVANETDVSSKGGKPVAIQPPVQMQCPKCLKNFTFSKKTAAASFANHVRVCDPAKKSETHKAPVSRKRQRSSAGAQEPQKVNVIDSEQRQKSSSKKSSAKAAADEPEFVTIHCVKCGKDFNFSKKTAAASFGNHLRKCDPERYEAMRVDKLQRKKTSYQRVVAGLDGERPAKGRSIKPRRCSVSQKVPEDVELDGSDSLPPVPLEKGGTVEQKKPAPVAKPDQIVLKQPAIASINTDGLEKSALRETTKNEANIGSTEESQTEENKTMVQIQAPKSDCAVEKSALNVEPAPKRDPNVASKPATITTTQTNSLHKGSLGNPSTKPTPNPPRPSAEPSAFAAAAISPHQTLPEKTATMPINQAVSPTKPRKPTAVRLPNPATPTPAPIEANHEIDVILSLKNPRYKQVMFGKYQTLGLRKGGGEENKRLDEMKHELFSFFRQGMGDRGRFLKSDRHMNDTWEVDDRDALESKCFAKCFFFHALDISTS